LKVARPGDRPGDFVTTLGSDAGMDFAFGESLRDGEGVRLVALFIEGAGSSRRAEESFLSPN